MKKFLCLIAMLVLCVVTVAGCGKKENDDVKPESNSQNKILVLCAQTTGSNFIAMKKILNHLMPELDFDYDIQLFDANNETGVVSTIDAHLANGYKGVISMGAFAADNTFIQVLDKCQAAGAFYAGYQQDFSRNRGVADQYTVHPAYVGTVTDGEASGNIRGEALFNAVVASTDRKLVLAQYPHTYFPQASVAVTKFKSLVTAYNETHTDKFEIVEGPDEQGAAWTGINKVYKFNFGQALTDNLAIEWKNLGVQAIIGFNSIGKLLNSPLQQNGNNAHVYTVGWDDDLVDVFGAGKRIQCAGSSPTELIIVPLVQLLNAMTGKKFADADKAPAQLQFEGKYVYVTAQNYESAKQNSMVASEDHAFSRALFTVEQAKGLLAANGGTYEKLVSLINSWTSEYCLTRK